jgi:hypothetical protein
MDLEEDEPVRLRLVAALCQVRPSFDSAVLAPAVSPVLASRRAR